MKSFLRIMVVIFSIIMVCTSVLSLLLVSQIITINMIEKLINIIILSKVFSTGVFIISIFVSILAIISIIGSDNLRSNVKGGIIIPAEIGEVQISNQTFENIITSVTNKYAGIKTAKVEVKVSEDGLITDIFAYVLQDTVIADITAKLQDDIKSTVMKQTTIVVKNVNIKIKGTYTLAISKE